MKSAKSQGSGHAKQHGDSHWGGLLRNFCIIGRPVLHLPTKHDSCYFTLVYCQRIIPLYAEISFPVQN